ncbi:hypothetical protein V6Z11_D04G216400 [Gossypium hirsutum]
MADWTKKTILRNEALQKGLNKMARCHIGDIVSIITK